MRGVIVRWSMSRLAVVLDAHVRLDVLKMFRKVVRGNHEAD